MCLRYSVCLMLLVSFLGSACTSAAGFEKKDLPVAAAAPAAMPGAQDWQTLVESLASHPEVLNQDWTAARRVLPVGCFRQKNTRDINCPQMEGVVRISIDPGPGGIIDVVLMAPADCQLVYALMNRHLGEGVLENNDKCTAEWNLKRWVKRANANLSVGRKDPSKLYLQFAVEQGP